MTPEIFFKLANGFALIGWIVLIFLPRSSSDKIILGVVITLLSIAYLYLVLTEFKPADFSQFGSLEGVMLLFQNRAMLLAGWIHYLAFDLMVGLWIKNNSLKHRINHWIIVPCLFLTFMLGPVGLLLYLITRIFVTKKYFSENF